ncbi:MAG: hypothetical protein JNL50_05355 [Phycisphaerae bacterium]|nr:hypothetical protein [Phycisphaerae bacterium]
MLPRLAWAQWERAFRFDDGVTLDPGLTWTFSRAATAVDVDGGLIAADTPRFAPRALLCGAPQVTTVAGTTLPITGIHVMSAGLMSDNTTPAWIIYNATQGRFEVHVGSVGGSVYMYTINTDASKNNHPDLLKESVDADPNEVWVPRSATICHGFAVVLCNVSVKTAGAWKLNRMGIAVCNLANLSGPKNLWWRRHARSDALDVGNDFNYMFGALWAMPRWWVRERDGQAPTEFWITAADYRAHPQKDGGMYFVMPVRRSGQNSSDWAADKVMELPGRFARVNQNVTHAHAAGLCGYGAQGLLVLGARGDGLYNNANYTWTIGTASGYRAGATARPDSFEWYAGGANWAGPKLVSGFVGEPADPVLLRRPGNQWIGIAPGPTDRTFVVGLDEVHQALALSGDMSGDPDGLDYRGTYGIARMNLLLGASENSTPGRFLSFHVQAQQPNSTGTAYVAQLSPSQFESDRTLSGRVLYSPDGENWGQMWAHRENEQTRPAIAAGRVWVGSAGQGLGLGVRSTPAPATMLARPLSIAPGGTNLTATFSSAGDAAPGVTVTPVSLPDGIATRAPADGPAFLVVNAPTGNSTAVSYLGSIVLAPSFPASGGVATIRFWVRNATSEHQPVAGSLSLRFRLRSTDADGKFGSTKVSGYCPQIEVPSAGDWVPVTLTTDVGAWGGQATSQWLELLVSTGATALPGAFHIALESVNPGGAVMFPAPAGGGGGGERAELGFERGGPGDTTALVAAMVPWDNWGTMTLDPVERPLFSLVSADGLRAAVVCADPVGKALRLRTWVDGVYDDLLGAAIPGVYWLQGSPVLCGLTYDAAGSRVILRGSVGGTEIGVAERHFAGLGDANRLVFGDPTGAVATPLYVFAGKVDETAWSAASVDQALRVLDLVPKGSGCVADFDRDGFVNGNDYDLFAEAFDLGEPGADMDGDGFVNGNDYDLFAEAFDAGC